jgi:hypothetical protein
MIQIAILKQAARPFSSMQLCIREVVAYSKLWELQKTDHVSLSA